MTRIAAEVARVACLPQARSQRRYTRYTQSGSHICSELARTGLPQLRTLVSSSLLGLTL